MKYIMFFCLGSVAAKLFLIEEYLHAVMAVIATVIGIYETILRR